MQKLNVTLIFKKLTDGSQKVIAKTSVIWFYSGEVILGLILLLYFMNILINDMEEDIKVLPMKFTEDIETRKLVNNEGNRSQIQADPNHLLRMQV